MPISSCMTLSVITATSNQTIRDVCTIMCEHKIGSVIIVENTATEKGKNTEYSKPIGIITERDIVTHLGSKKPLSSLQTPVFEIMSHPLIIIQSNSSLKDGIETMQLKNIRRLPVINKEKDSDKMVGIVTEKDIFRAIMKVLQSSQNTVENLMNDQMQFGYRFMYERFINEDYFTKDTHPGLG
jgi:CBS domain-containing protein